MSSISLPLAQARPEPARIAALSAAIALNLAVILIAARPLPVSLPTLPRLVPPPALVRLISPSPQPPAPPPVELKPLPQALPTPQVMPHPVVARVPSMPVADGQLAAPVQAAAPAAATDSGTPAPVAAVEASLAYLAHPITYPAHALRGHLEGTVVLRVLVDETGKPLEVGVLRSSGHAELDRSAREQVLAHWRFQPAIVNGHATRAWASVPVTFTLRG